MHKTKAAETGIGAIWIEGDIEFYGKCGSSAAGEHGYTVYALNLSSCLETDQGRSRRTNKNSDREHFRNTGIYPFPIQNWIYVLIPLLAKKLRTYSELRNAAAKLTSVIFYNIIYKFWPNLQKQNERGFFETPPFHWLDFGSTISTWLANKTFIII